MPVGRAIGPDVVPDPYEDLPETAAGAGSIIVIVATDAPLLPHQCRRLAQRAALGIARTGGAGRALERRHLARVLDRAPRACRRARPSTPASRSPCRSRCSWTRTSTPLFYATIEATEAAIVNALLAAETMTGRAA